MMAAATFKRDGRKQEKEGERLWGKETGTIIPSTSYPMATLLVATVVTLESPAFHLTHLVNQEPTSDIQNLSRKPDSHSLQPVRSVSDPRTRITNSTHIQANVHHRTSTTHTRPLRAPSLARTRPFPASEHAQNNEFVVHVVPEARWRASNVVLYQVARHEVSGTCADATIAFLGLENPRNATLGSLGAGVTIERLCTSWHLSFPLTITTVHEQAKKVYIRALEGWEEQM
uniref:Uncharacterized protein n=2 Tax=Moniliophthora roreri TaxID=221103 RepID=A0A0W0GBH1_MONRR